jgi:LCP family protein required for cell wall assembly
MSSPSPTIAAVLSLILPGLGQFYAGARGRGVLLALPWLLLLVGIVLVATGGTNALLGLVFNAQTRLALLVLVVAVFFYHAAVILDAYVVALRSGHARGAPARGSLAAVALLLALLLVPYGVVEVYGIQTSDAMSTIFRGDNRQDSSFTEPFQPEGTPPPSEPTTPPTASPSPTATETDTPGTAAPSPTATDEPTTTDEPMGSPISPHYGPIDAPWAENGRLDILLIGADAGPGRSSVRTDTMILVSVEIETGKAAMFGFPRNITDVPLPDESAGAYPGGRFPEMISGLWRRAAEQPDRFAGSEGIGRECQRQWECERGWRAISGTIQKLAGVPIDGIIGVDLNGFALLVDAVGGVWIDVPARVVDDRYPREDGTRIQIDIKPGCQKLDGTMALAYARSRHQDSDYQRMRRQQYVLAALRRQFDPLALVPRVPELLNIARDNVFISIDEDDIPLMAQVADRVDADRIHQVRLQGARHPRAIDDESWERIRTRVRNIFDEPEPEPTATPRRQGERCPPR